MIISIIVPCYNEERYIKNVINSILKFKLPVGVDFECFIIDGCSNDNTINIINESIKSDVRFKLLINENKYQSYALNLGIVRSKGEYILRLDAHTIYPENYLLLCFETAIKFGVDNVGGVCLTKPGSDNYEAKIVQALTTHPFGIGNSGFRINSGNKFTDTVPFGFFKKDVFERIGLFNTDLIRTQDYEFNARIRKYGGQIYLNSSIVSYYFNLSSLFEFYKKQFLFQGPYNVVMWSVAPYSFNLRHSVTLFFSLFILILPFLLLNFYLKAVSIVLILLYFLLAIFSSLQQAIIYKEIRHMIFLPICFFLFHFLHGLGALCKLVFLVLEKMISLKKEKNFANID